ncbi:MAG TPA: DUF6427 family protein [Bacteroidales bacterium]|nr:DUF6427 family protein [Bacteroidales bacterium]
MLRFFRSSFATQYAVIVLAGVLLWTRAFFDPPPMPVPEGPVPFYKLIYYLFSSMPSLAVVISFVFTLFSAFYLNYMLSRYEIIIKNASLPAFIFIVLISYFPLILTLHPVTISIVFLLLILANLFSAYRRAEPLDTTFSVGFMTAIASFFYFPFIFFFILILISFILFRIPGWREWVSAILGLLTPFLFLFVYYFWNDTLLIKTMDYLQAFRINFPMDFLRNINFVVFTVMIVLLLFVGFFSGISHLNEKTLEIRRKISILIWLIPVMLLSFAFSGQFVKYHLMITFIPVSSLLSVYFLGLKRSFWQETILLSIFIIILLNNLFLILT